MSYNICILVTPTSESVHSCSEKELQELFAPDKFGSDSRIDVDDLETMLSVDRDHLDCEMSKEYLDKVLDFEKYQDILWRREEGLYINKY